MENLFFPNQPDGCAKLFSYLAEMLSAETRPSKSRMFSKDAFHALEPPYLVRLIEKDKAKLMFNILTRILELGFICASSG